MNWDDVSRELKMPLALEAIKPPAQGKYGEYIDGLHAIREANRIFGEGGWSYEITRLEMTSRVETKKSNGDEQVRLSYLCSVRVSVGDVSREGGAVGMGIVKIDNEADGHESAVKEAETDALKRALRSFGNTFGLALYEKDKSRRDVAPQQSITLARRINSITSISQLNNASKPTSEDGSPLAKSALARKARELGATLNSETGKYEGQAQ